MKISRRKFLLTGILGSIGLLITDAFWFERYFVEWNTFDLNEDHSRGVKILQLSDLHLKSIKSFHRQLASKINQLNPDLIIFSGDAIDKGKNLNVLDNFLSRIDRTIPKYASTGNWEYWGNVDLVKLKSIYEKHGALLLINQNKSIEIRGKKVTIIGVDDFVGGKPDFRKSIYKMERSDKNIVISHCPEHFDHILKEKGDLSIDLVLSGHTHGGQVNLFGFVPFKPVGSGKYLKGWYNQGDSKLYVSKGVGTSILPFRFGSRAEVTIFYI